MGFISYTQLNFLTEIDGKLNIPYIPTFFNVNLFYTIFFLKLINTIKSNYLIIFLFSQDSYKLTLKESIYILLLFNYN